MEPEETGSGRRWIRWMHKRGIKTWVVPGIIAGATLLKFAMALGSYSGVHICLVVDIHILIIAIYICV